MAADLDIDRQNPELHYLHLGALLHANLNELFPSQQKFSIRNLVNVNINKTRIY